MTFTEFLLARIAEDEAAASRLELCPYVGGDPGNGALHVPAARVLAECEAKRRIVEMHHGIETTLAIQTTFKDRDLIALAILQSSLATTTAVLQLHAQVHADHPDYDESWRP